MKANPAERLVRFVMREYGSRLTPKQIREPWEHLRSPNGEIIGVIVPGDGGSSSFRVMLHEADGKSGFTTDSPPPLDLA
jgi:hypothetical protein